MRRAAAQGDPFNFDWKMTATDGSERWLLLRGAPDCDSPGDRRQYRGVIIDVTEDRSERDGLMWSRRKIDDAHRVARIGVWEWRMDSGEITWTPELYRLLHRDPALPAPTFEQLERYYTGDAWRTLSGAIQEAVSTGKPYDIDLEMVREDGSHVWARTVGSVLCDESGSVIGLHGTVHDFDARMRAVRELEAGRRRLTELTAQLMSSAERERREISYGLHDDVGQMLAAVKLALQQMEKEYGGAAVGEEAARLCTMIDYCIEGVRFLAGELSPAALYELGLGPALQSEASRLADEEGLQCELAIDDACMRLTSESAVFMYRAARTLLDNVVQHSGVLSARVTVYALEDSIVLAVSDEGNGFDASGLHSADGVHGHLGLLSIRERAHFMGGTLEIDAKPGRGTRVDVRVPIHADE